MQMSCNVGQYLPEDDSPRIQIERVLHLNLRSLPPTHQGRGRRGRSFIPKRQLEIEVVSNEGDRMSLKAYRWKGGLVAELHIGNEKLRSFHTHSGHRHPHGCYRMTNGHMHFPTNKFPLVYGGNSYAYEQHCSDADCLNTFVELFCSLLNISIDTFQLFLGTGGRR